MVDELYIMNSTPEHKRVLLTGVTGFLGSHTAIQLLQKGYHVLGTLRDIDRADSIRNTIGKYTTNSDNLTFAEADLLDRNIWRELTKNMDFVQHIASPFPAGLPKSESDLLLPARSGTLDIMEAATLNGVKRIVVTSSIGAIAYGKSSQELKQTLDENSWTDENNLKDTTAYYRSKTIAEKAAWDYLKNNDTGLELSTVCPGAILGPILENDFGTSANIVISLLNGSLPALPKIRFDVVDVRSVADLLIRVMEMPKAAGNRYIAASARMSFKDIAVMLKQTYPGIKIPRYEMPGMFTRLLSLFQPLLKPVLLETVQRRVDLNKAKRELQWMPISAAHAVISCAESAIKHKLIASWKN